MKNENVNGLIKKVLDILIFRISRRFPMVDLIYPFLEICHEMPREDVGKKYLFLTDGVRLYVSPSILSEYRKHPVKLEIMCLHQLLHVSLGHPVFVPETERGQYDYICDQAVWNWITDLYKEYRIGVSLRVEKCFFYPPVSGTEQEDHALWYRKQREDKKGDKKNAQRSGGMPGGHLKFSEAGKEKGKEGAAGGIELQVTDKKQAEEIWKKIQNTLSVLKDTPGGKEKSFAIGNEHGGTASYLESVKMVSDVRYQDILREYIDVKEMECAVNDELDPILYSYGLELYDNIPFVEAPEVIDLCVAKFFMAIDTSGSCESDMLKKFIGQTRYIIEELSMHGKQELDIYLFLCDRNIEQEFHITCMEEFPKLSELRITGGGTDFRPVFERIGELRKKGDGASHGALFYYTDGMGVFPDKKTDYDTYFLMEKQDMQNIGVPEWIKKVEI